MGSCIGIALKCEQDKAVYYSPNAIIRDTNGIVSWET